MQLLPEYTEQQHVYARATVYVAQMGISCGQAIRLHRAGALALQHIDIVDETIQVACDFIIDHRLKNKVVLPVAFGRWLALKEQGAFDHIID